MGAEEQLSDLLCRWAWSTHFVRKLFPTSLWSCLTCCTRARTGGRVPDLVPPQSVLKTVRM